MSEKIDIEKLREEVNPVYSTAQSCLQLIAATGDEDSENLRKTLGFTVFGADVKERGGNVPPEMMALLMKVVPVFNALPEVRFFGSNNIIKEFGTKQVMDLPCGYTARGIKLAKSGVRYFGMDLPAVIDSMEPAVKKVIGENENISYHSVDATNYNSLRKALEGAKGEITITTEGMLMYFTQSELETVFANIRRLLLEFGGRWITVDNEMDEAQTNTIKIITSDMSKEEAQMIGPMVAGAVSKTTLSNNSFFGKDREKIKKFVEDMGFDVELVPMSKYMPDTLASFSKYPENIQEKAAEEIGRINFWIMTAKPGVSESFTCKEDNFNADVKLEDGRLNIILEGRLDTITSPGLLALYREAEAKGDIRVINIDMEKLEYISSAGLRVLLIMRKAVDDADSFNILNMKEEIREIIETTGFDSIFC